METQEEEVFVPASRDSRFMPVGRATPAIGQPVGLLSRELLEQITEQIEILKELKLRVLKITNDQDWVDLDGHPHPRSGAVCAIAASIGLEFGDPEITEVAGQDSRGKFVRYECWMSAEWRGQRIRDLGTATTRDPFYCRAHGKEIPLEEIDLGEVKQKSITNAQYRVLTKKFGLGSLTWGQLEEAGVTKRRGAGGSARFKGGEQKMATGAGGVTDEKKRLWGMLLELCGDDVTQAEDWLFEHAKPPKRDVYQLTDSSAKFLLERHIEPAYKKLLEQQNAAGPQAAAAAPCEPGAEG